MIIDIICTDIDFEIIGVVTEKQHEKWVQADNGYDEYELLAYTICVVAFFILLALSLGK
jgi:hypothetical protein